MRVRIRTMTGWEYVEGVPVKIGVISDLFAATPHVLPQMWAVQNRWNITHMPSGHCYVCYASSPNEAVSEFSRVVQHVGRKSYQKAVRKAMKRARPEGLPSNENLNAGRYYFSFSYQGNPSTR